MQKNTGLKNFYDKVYAKGEEKHFTSFVTKGTPTSEVIEVLKEINWRNKKVLDVGCGTGLFAYNVAKKGADVLGIDFSRNAIEQAQKKYKIANLRFEQLDVTKVTGEYDIIVSIGTLEHMDSPLNTLKLLKKHLKSNGRIIITSPNWTNPRGYILITLWHLFKAPITLADLHYQTPIDFIKYAKKLNMNLKWRTFDRSWAHGEVLIQDFRRRLPNVLRDVRLQHTTKNINNLIKWMKENVVPLDNSLPHSGAIGLYVFSRRTKK